MIALEAGVDRLTLCTLMSLWTVTGTVRFAEAQLLAVLLSAGLGGGVMAMQFVNWRL